MRACDMATVWSRRDNSIPSVTLVELTGGRPVLILAPHPDDESLGCGALLAAAFALSGDIRLAHVACLTDGAASHAESQSISPAQLADIRKLELQTAIKRLGGDEGDFTWIGAPDAGLVASQEIVARLAALAQKCNARLVLAPSPLDPHRDHVAGALIGRKVASAHADLRLAYYPIWSRWHGGGHAPVPAGTLPVRFPVGSFATRKASAITAHASQLGRIVPDAPGGFEMPPGFASFFAEEDEIYFLGPPDMAL